MDEKLPSKFLSRKKNELLNDDLIAFHDEKAFDYKDLPEVIAYIEKWKSIFGSGCDKNSGLMASDFPSHGNIGFFIKMFQSESGVCTQCKENDAYFKSGYGYKDGRYCTFTEFMFCADCVKNAQDELCKLYDLAVFANEKKWKGENKLHINKKDIPKCMKLLEEKEEMVHLRIRRLEEQISKQKEELTTIYEMRETLNRLLLYSKDK